MKGVIVNIPRKQQINDFSGLKYGNITPTDIDGVIEFHDKNWIFLEVKYMGAELPFGQKLALERMVADTSAKGKCSIAVVAEHKIHNPDKSIPVASCLVREFYHHKYKKWRPPKQPISVKKLIDIFLDVGPTANNQRSSEATVLPNSAKLLTK